LSEQQLLLAAGSQALLADIVAGVVLLIIVIVETIHVLRQSRGQEGDGEGGVRGAVTTPAERAGARQTTQTATPKRRPRRIVA
jgi:hypothetical protein